MSVIIMKIGPKKETVKPKFENTSITGNSCRSNMSFDIVGDGTVETVVEVTETGSFTTILSDSIGKKPQDIKFPVRSSFVVRIEGETLPPDYQSRVKQSSRIDIKLKSTTGELFDQAVLTRSHYGVKC